MGLIRTVIWLQLSALLLGTCQSQGVTDERVGKLYLEYYNEQSMVAYYDFVEASWDYNTNLTEHNMKKSLEEASRLAAFEKRSYEQASKFSWKDFSFDVKRQFEKISDIGVAVLPEDDIDRHNYLLSAMEEIYSTATVCNKPGDTDPSACYPLDPDLTTVMESSTDWDELVWAWEGWRNESGRKMPDMYKEATDLMNEAAIANGLEDNGDYWRSWYETEGFEEEVARLWEELKPIYQQLHAYVRGKLSEVYKDHPFPTSGHIPAHILGDQWAQQWNNIERFVLPYPDKPSIDVTEEMINQGYDTRRMFDLSEEFFTSLGLDPMPASFWTDSMLDKPTDRSVVCHASAWDFYNQKDFRVKQCTEVDTNWLITTHHEMGHIEYYLQYKHQPTVYRDGANPGFHEAIGDVLELSVSTPEHLYKVGLFPGYNDDEEVTLNALMSLMLKKIAFVPFGYLIDKWRWDMFRGDIPREQYNSAWWKLRCEMQGVSPPVTRSDDLDFDPGAKFHVPKNVPYIRYFVSYILQFQIHKALCDAAGHTGPLHKCDIYQSADAGQLFRDMMSVGSSRLWPDVLEEVTGSREMTIEPLKEFFKPILDWMKEQNEGVDIGWDNECSTV